MQSRVGGQRKEADREMTQESFEVAATERTETTSPFPHAVTPNDQFPFKVVAKVGEGSMGAVYRAVEPALDRTVAVKVLHREGMESFWKSGDHHEARLRFLQEARSAAAIQHPGAVTIHRIGEVGDVLYIAMEWLGGGTLADHMRDQGPLSVEESVGAAKQILGTVQAAHEAGVIHRDIKPANLMLTRSGTVKVTDFGIARLRTDSLVKTQAGVVFGTPYYASPEQLRGDEVDHRTDVYAVAVVLYEMLTGHVPVAGQTYHEFLQRLLNESLEPVRKTRPDVPWALDEVILRGLARDRDERWVSAAAMADALGRAQRDGDLSAPVVHDKPTPAGAAGEGVRLTERNSYTVVHCDRASLADAAVKVARSWESQAVPSQPVGSLLLKLLDRPLHAPAFSGGVDLEGTLLLIHDGAVVAALAAAENGGPVVATDAPRLPAAAAGTLYRPNGLSPLLAPQLAALVRGGTTSSSVVDAAVVNAEALARRLKEEHFSGALRLRVGRDENVVLFGEGRETLGLAVGDWQGVPVATTWSRWVTGLPATIELESLDASPLPLTYEVLHRDLEVRCDWRKDADNPGSTTGRLSSRLPRLSTRLARRQLSARLEPVFPGGSELRGLDSDPAYRLLRWMVEDAPASFPKESLAERWKYFAQWIPLVVRARLHHDLPAPGSDARHRFDLVTEDRNGKILHLARRFDQITRSDFDAAVSKALEAKEARLATGDIGAVLLVAPSFPSEVVQAYLERVEAPGGAFSRFQESITGYAGFVRVGAKRGFHLLLVEAREGGFEALLD